MFGSEYKVVNGGEKNGQKIWGQSVNV